MNAPLKSELRALISASNFEKLHQLLKQLSWQHRCALHLRFWEDQSISQIAGSMNLTWEQADQLIEEAVEQLRTEIKQLTTKPAARLAA